MRCINSKLLLSLLCFLLASNHAFAAGSLTETAAQSVSQATLLAGEDQTNNVIRVEGQFSYSGPKTADTQIKASAGFLHAITCNSDAAATAGTLIIYDNTAESGTQIHSITFGTGFYPPATMIFDVVFSTGLYLGFTTTADVTCTVSYR